MKRIRKITTFLVVLILSLSFSTTVASVSDDTADYMAAKQFYDSVVQSAEWKAETSRKSRGEMLQLPDDMLKSMTTDVLIEAVLDYPFFSDVYAFDNIQDGFDAMFLTFNGVRELSAREDAASVLLRKYKNEKVITDANSNVFRLTNMEILLSQSFVLSQLTEDEKNDFADSVSNKYKQKIVSDTYGEFTNKIIFDLIEKNSDDADLITQMQSVRNSTSLTE